MDETIKSLIVQAPMVGVLLYAIKVLYLDMKADRVAAAAERAFMLQKLDKQSEQVEKLAIGVARVERACGADMLPPASKV